MNITGRRHVIVGLSDGQPVFEGSLEECRQHIDEQTKGLYLGNEARPMLAILAPHSLITITSERRIHTDDVAPYTALHVNMGVAAPARHK